MNQKGKTRNKMEALTFKKTNEPPKRANNEGNIKFLNPLHLIYILKHLYKLRLVDMTSCEMVDAQFSTSKGFVEMLWDVRSSIYQDWDKKMGLSGAHCAQFVLFNPLSSRYCI
jgi:hypothetical protein